MWIEYPTPRGEAWIAWQECALVRLGLPGTQVPDGRRNPLPPGWVEELTGGLTAYFSGTGLLPVVPSAITLPATTPFRRAVHAAVAAIPHGATSTYSDIASEVGRPSAARAIGSAMADNPVAPLIPCHRVVGSDGGLRGYAGGIDMKRWLIDMEARDA